MQKTKKSYGIYHALTVLPETVYPFKNEVDGAWVRGRASYEKALHDYQKRYGAPRYGYKLELYRSLFHIMGSILFIVTAAMVSKMLLGSDTALYGMVVLLILFITYQEFYLQPHRHMQRFQKGIVDWVCWVTPVAAYFWFHL